MKTKYVLGSLVLLSGIAQAAPGFAQDRNYPDRAPTGSFGMDVAAGGTYTRRDVANEKPDRMSHPIVGERRAMSRKARWRRSIKPRMPKPRSLTSNS